MLFHRLVACIFHYIDIFQFIHSFMGWHTSSLLPVSSNYEWSVYLQELIWSLTIILRVADQCASIAVIKTKLEYNVII